MSSQVTQTTISALTFDNRNANRGTARGRGMLEDSLSENGAGRSILLDKHGRIIAGNKTAEVALEIGMDEVVIVHTTGKTLVAVQRDDLDLSDKHGQARRLAYADNRVGQVSLDFDPVIVALDLDEGVSLGGLFYESELHALLNPLSDSPLMSNPNMPQSPEPFAMQCQCPQCGHVFTP